VNQYRVTGLRTPGLRKWVQFGCKFSDEQMLGGKYQEVKNNVL